MRFALLRLLRHGAQENHHGVMVNRISWITGETQLHEYFSRYGKVTQVSVPLDPHQGVNKGFGFVHFKNKAEMSDALEDHSRPLLDGKRIQVLEATKKSPDRTKKTHEVPAKLHQH